MNWLSNLFSGAQKLFSGVGNAFGGAVQSGADFGQKLMAPSGGISSLFGQASPATSKVSSPTSMGRPSMGHMTSPTATQAPSTAMASFPSGLGNMGHQPVKPNDKKSTNWLDSLFPGGKESGIAGLAIPAIGNMFAPKSPEIPDFGGLSSVQAMQNFRPGNSVSPEYNTMLTNNTNRLRDKRLQDLQATYRSARPGTDYLTDTNYQRDAAEIERQVQTQMSDDLAKAEGTFSAQEQERLSQLAQMDIYSIMAQTGMDAQEANDFKQMFSNVGNMFLTNATKKPNQFEDMMSMFGGA